MDPIAHFSAKLRFETDPADLAIARSAGTAPLVIDVRSRSSWDQGHIPGALHCPRSELADAVAAGNISVDDDIVVYCWGPGCNGSTRAALELSHLGCAQVRELIGGFEYWAREGFAVQAASGRSRRAPDPLTAPVTASSGGS